MLSATAFALLMSSPAATDSVAFAPDVVPVILGDIDGTRLKRDVETLVGFHTRNTFSTVEGEGKGIGAARRWIEREFNACAEASGGRLQVRTQVFTTTVRSRRGTRDAEFVNVYGFLPGAHGDPKGRTYVVSGHYDSITNNPFDPDAFAPGADDDASGTAVVLELARAMSRHTFDANLVFICVPGEEQGLYGSKQFAAWTKEEGWDVDAMITNDIVGGIEGGNGVVDENTIRVFSGGEGLHDPSRELARSAFDVGAKYLDDTHVRLIFRLDRVGRGGDHIPFHEQGVAALRFTEANEHYARQHKTVAEIGGVQYGDLPEYVSGDYMARVARLNAATLATLALAPAPPRNLSLRGAMSYDTTLRWTPSPSEAAAGYVIVWRETTSPTWQHQSEVIPGLPTRGDSGQLQHTLEGVIADNHFFGIRAVNQDGHQSRTVVPGRP